MDVSRASIVVLLLVSQSLLTTTDDNSTTDYNNSTTTQCDERHSVEIVNGEVLANGSILAPDGLMYGPKQFLVNDSNSDIVRGCICELKKCVRKCCPDDHIYFHNKLKLKCVSKNHSLLQPFLPMEARVGNQEDIHVFAGHVCQWQVALGDRVDEYNFHSNGQLLDEYDEPLHLDEYCLEVYFKNGSDSADVTMFFCAEEPPPDTLPKESEEIVQSAKFVLYSLGMIISEPFLLATFLVYAIIPELRNIHGKNLMSYVSSLFFAYLFLIIVQLGVNTISTGCCVALAFIIYFSFLASFFWLNVMCFDLWWTFRRTLIPHEPDQKMFFFYSLYAWGASFIMLIVVMIMHYKADSHPLTSSYVIPGFGVEKCCWFYTNGAIWAYFYGPVAVILTVNLVMFITTAFKIVQLKKETAMLEGSESKRHDDESKQRCTVFFKLFLVMGINWILEVVGAAVGGPEYLWIISDIGNTLQGVLIFFIFVWNARIRKMIKRRFGASSGRMATRLPSSRKTSLSSTSTSDMSMMPMTSTEQSQHGAVTPRSINTMEH